MDGAAADYASPRSEVIDEDDGARIDVEGSGGEKGEDFEEAAEGILDDSGGSDLVRNVASGGERGVGDGEVDDGEVASDKFWTVEEVGAGEVDGETMLGDNGFSMTTVEPLDLDDDYGGGRFGDASRGGLENGHPDHEILQVDDNFVSDVIANHGSMAQQSNSAVKELFENMQSSSDGGVEIHPNADTMELKRVAEIRTDNVGSEFGGRTSDDAVNDGTRYSAVVESVYETSSNVVEQKDSQPTTAVGTETSSAPSPQCAGLGSSTLLPESDECGVPQARLNGSTAKHPTPSSEDAAVSADVEDYDETREKLQAIRVNFLRLARRLGQTPHNVVVAQVLYRLGLAEQLRGSATRTGAFSFDRASAIAEQREASGHSPLDFSCTIMVIGKTGVGKSATINSIFDEYKFRTDAFSLGTKKVQDVVGTVQGIKVRVIDTPGLLPSLSDQLKNEKILLSVKKFIKKTPPDVIMYLDRLDMQNRDMGDIPLLQTVTNVFGASIWINVIVVLTHATSSPPEGANGTPMSYEMYVSQRTHIIQNAIRQVAGDSRLLNPVSLVENHSACRMNRAGQRVLPNGQIWKPQLLLLSFASKILAEANALLKLQDGPSGRPFSAQSRVPPLPFFLSSLLQPKANVKLPEEQYGNDDGLDMDLDGEFDLDDDIDYDDLPPFKNLTMEELSKLSKVQKRAYYKELDYREKLFYKKQMKVEKERRKLLKQMEKAADGEQQHVVSNENVEEIAGPASIPVPTPDLALPASFDSDHPSYRYRFLDSSQWLVKPVLESQGWDHDVGYEGLNIDKTFVVKDCIPVSFSGHIMKDKKDFTLQMELASSMKPKEGMITSCGMEVQRIGKDIACIVCGETKVTSFKRNNMVAGVSASFLGGTSSVGLKIEDTLVVKKWLRMLVSGGLMTCRGDVAYGGRFEATLRDKDYPIGRLLCTLALSAVDWHGEFALIGNVQSQVPIGRSMNLSSHVNVGSRGSGQIGIRLNSSEHLQIALLALLPLLKSMKMLLLGSSESMQ